jgi:paraquat-inducible protein B
MTNNNPPVLNEENQVEILNRKGISIIWFIPVIALIFGLWLGITAISEQGKTIQVEFENGVGIVPNKTEVRYKGLVTGMVKTVSPSDDLQHVIATIEMSKKFTDYLTENTRFWLVTADISLQGVSGLETLVSGSYINILPKPDESGSFFKSTQSYFVAQDGPPPLDMSTPGLHLTLETTVLGSISQNSPITFKQMTIGYVSSYKYIENTKKIALNIFIEPEFAHLIKENSLFWNASGVQVTASLSTGVKVNTESLASIISGGIAVDTLSYQVELPPASNGQIFPLHADFQSAETGHEIELTLGWNSGVNHNAAIMYQGLTIGSIKSFKKIDPKERKITAIAHINPRVVPYLTEQSQFYIVAPEFGLSGFNNVQTLITGNYISIRPSLQGKATNKFTVYNSKPAYRYDEDGLHLILISKQRQSLKVGSGVFYEEEKVGNIQAIETKSPGRHLLHVHILPAYADYVTEHSHFYNNSGFKISANLQGVNIEAQSLQTMLTGGLAFVNDETIVKEEINPDDEINLAHRSAVKNGDTYHVFDNKKQAQQRTLLTLNASIKQHIEKGTRLLYRSKEVGSVHHIEENGTTNLVTVGILPNYKHILKQGTKFWLVKPNLSLSGATDTDALLGGDYITFNALDNQNISEQQLNSKTNFFLLGSPPAKAASESGLQLTLITNSAQVATPGSAVSYRGVVVGQVDNVTLDKKNDNIAVNITIDDEHKSFIKEQSRFYNASGFTLSGGLDDFVVKTESVDAILRGGISFYTPEKFQAETPTNVAEHSRYSLFESIAKAENSGLAIQVHFKDISGLDVGSTVLYQEQELGEIERLIFKPNVVGATALIHLNDKGVLYAKPGTQFWKVEPEIGLVGSKNVQHLLNGAFITLLPKSSEIDGDTITQTHFNALELPLTLKHLPYGLNIKLNAKRLNSVRVGNPILYRQIIVGKVIGVDLANTADSVDIFINIASRYAPLITPDTQFWNTSGVKIEAGLFSGVSINSESIETLIAGGIAFATPEVHSDIQADLKAQGNALPLSYTLHQQVEPEWLEWQPVINIKP